MKPFNATAFVIFIFCLPYLIKSQFVFDYDVCKYGVNASRMFSIYSKNEIEFNCKLFAQEETIFRNIRPSQRMFRPDNLPIMDFSLIEDDNKYMLQRRRRSIINVLQKNISITDTVFKNYSPKDAEEVCSKTKYQESECGINARRYLYEQIKSEKIDLKNKTQLSDLLYQVGFIDFSLYFRPIGEVEIKEFLDVVDVINWDTEIEDHFTFQNIIWRIVNSFDSFIRGVKNQENILHILVAHEKIFSNILQWKIMNADYIFKLYFSNLKTIYFHSENSMIIERMNNYIFEMNNIVKNNGFLKSQYERFQLYAYTNYAKVLNNNDLKNFKTNYTRITSSTVLNNTITGYIGEIKVILKYQHGSYVENALQELQTVYDRFLFVFNSTNKLQKNKFATIEFKIFKDKKEYTTYSSFFDFASNNGGITYGTKTHSDVYCYCVGDYIVNFGHEFVHALVNTYFDKSNSLSVFIHEGLAEAIGQKKYYVQNGLIENMFKSHLNLTYSNMTELTYNSDISIYALGFIVFKTIISNNQSDLLSFGLQTINKNSVLEDLINNNVKNYKAVANNYIQEYYRNVASRNNKNNTDVSFERVQKAFLDNYPGDNLTIEIDNTFFLLSKDNIYLSHYWPNGKYEREILNNPKNIRDMMYLFSFMVLTSVKQIPLFDTAYPELLSKSEDNVIYFNGMVLTNQIRKEQIFNLFFNMANSVGVNLLSQDPKSFSEVKETILTKQKIKQADFYRLSIPYWNATSKIQNAIYTINAGPNINLNIVRSINLTEKIDVNNRDLKEIFSEFFPINYLFDKRIINIVRKTGLNYLNKNIPLVQQFYTNLNVEINNLQTGVNVKETTDSTLEKAFGLSFKKDLNVTNIFNESKILNALDVFKKDIENKLYFDNIKTQIALDNIIKNFNKTQNKINKIIQNQNSIQSNLNLFSTAFMRLGDAFSINNNINKNATKEDENYVYDDFFFE